MRALSSFSHKGPRIVERSAARMLVGAGSRRDSHDDTRRLSTELNSRQSSAERNLSSGKSANNHGGHRLDASSSTQFAKVGAIEPRESRASYPRSSKAARHSAIRRPRHDPHSAVLSFARATWLAPDDRWKQAGRGMSKWHNNEIRPMLARSRRRRDDKGA